MKVLEVLGIIGLVVMLLVSPVLVYRAVKLGTVHMETLTITKKADRTIQKNADGSENDYAKLIYADKGVYINTDSWFPWKTRSSDVYDQLEVGHTYKCEVVGWRNGFMSWYKNIVTCDGFRYQ